MLTMQIFRIKLNETIKSAYALKFVMATPAEGVRVCTFHSQIFPWPKSILKICLLFLAFNQQNTSEENLLLLNATYVECVSLNTKKFSVVAGKKLKNIW